LLFEPERLAPFSRSKSANEPLSPEGDFDFDGLSNIDEYDLVILAGLDEAAYVEAATNASPFWSGNPAVPVTGIIGLSLLGAMFACGGAVGLRKKRK
jgi:LPXTG-motif cell wall-anchored protein